MLWVSGLCVTLTVITHLAVANPANWTDCGSTVGTIESVDITPCPTEPCLFHYNTDVVLKVDFVSNADTQDVTAVVFAIISGMPLPFPIPDPDACDSGVKCPVHKGAENTYRLEAYIDNTIPQVEMEVQIELKDDHADDIVCFKIPIKVVF